MDQTKDVPPNALNRRLYSLDALRGFDMFWIIGGEEIFHGLAKATNHPLWQTISTELTHPDWNGFHFYDLIFPLFLFLAGVSVPYSVGRHLENGKARERLLIQVIRRGFVLVILGIVYNNGLHLRPFTDIRFASVLGRIGLAYMCATIIYLYARQSWQLIWFCLILIFYWLLLKFTSAPGFAPGDLTIEGNFASWVDRTILPGRLYLGIHDPEGFFSTIPAISTGLLGILTGTVLRNYPWTPHRKTVYMAVAGLVLLLLSEIWNLDFPINKNLWTSSFVLHTGGYSLILLAIFYYIIDVLGYTRWAFFFRVIGLNSILIYMSGRVINWEYATNGLFKWIGDLTGDPFNIVVMAVCYVVTRWLFLYFLYEKKVFLRV